MVFISELDTSWSKYLATVVPGPKANGAQFRKATCILVKNFKLRKKVSVIHALRLDSGPFLFTSLS